ncbi:Transcriptional regulatory protein rxt3 [Gracilariopsis chorda]|uniref:Transcriptional regulatory protein rxt3 n=1 Tax=Gracilariopsis chorda TaxID=448386 RepID=A0A2V3J4L3_9FLOR|nr:Transcriptional regulatory protein rxt3 [Gracilariopsis chorda]|eukprot:PXF48310.1 Transcriptional regulatory protein rxt3 [Gracilariopsis chorda]
MKRSRTSNPSRRNSSAVHAVPHLVRRSLMEQVHIPPSRKHFSSNPPPKRARLLNPRSQSPPKQKLPPHYIYSPTRLLPIQSLLSSNSSATIHVHVPAEHLTPRNAALRNRLLWGTDFYTDDSDLVAILVHTGYYSLHTTPPCDYLTVTLRVQPHQSNRSPHFISSTRNSISSRYWPSTYKGARISVLFVNATHNNKVTRQPRQPPQSALRLPGIVLSHPSACSTASVKAATSYFPTQLSFDLLNNPCTTYNINYLASLKSSSESPLHRLNTHVLYLENHSQRFEVHRPSPLSNTVRFAQVRNVALFRSILAHVHVSTDAPCPMKPADLTAVQHLPWQHLHWDLSGVTVKGQWYQLTKMSFQKRTEPPNRQTTTSP